MAKKVIPVLVWKEGKLYVAKTLSLELASQGKTKREALKNLQEALDLLLEDEGIKIPSSFIPQNPKIEHIHA
jgi:predicted RNase H-like HicB family nuclease